MGWLSYAGWFFSFGAVGVAAILYVLQDYLVYVPWIENSRIQFDHPFHYRLQDYFEEHFITTPDNVKINVWLFRRPGDTSVPTILFFHGNAGNISHRLPNILGLFEKLDCNVAIMEYRGFGKSTGWPTQKGIQIDARTTLDWLHSSEKGTPQSPIILFGRSLGGAVAIDLAADEKYKDKIKGIIVENTFTSILDMMDHIVPWLTWAKLLCRNPWKSMDIVGKISVPMLFVSSIRDEMVPSKMMVSLHQKASQSNKNTKFLPINEGGHMSAYTTRGYYERFNEWLQSLYK